MNEHDAGQRADGSTDDRARLISLLSRNPRIVAFTGAGISTESGIPDFRSPGGVWTRYDPRDFTFDRYVDSAEVRASSWAMRREFLGKQVAPNPAHRALARLADAGRLIGVITQNIDGLHQVAGSPHVIEIHGTAREVMCIGHAPSRGTPHGCGFTVPYTWAFSRLDAGELDPACPECGGLVKSATVSFGQTLFPGVVEAAVELVEQADLVLTVGSSLQVYPAADLPVAAVRSGAALAIVNDEPTPLDDLADVVVRGRAGQVLPPAVDAALA
ncbi:MAG: Sir2 family NAD-dependent protein deacetylase [Actinomycetota bacterium]|nr:Sir2 family NAD-dependent protein deacetylase [Actinomycetota bacterium]